MAEPAILLAIVVVMRFAHLVVSWRMAVSRERALVAVLRVAAPDSVVVSRGADGAALIIYRRVEAGR